MEFQCLQKTVSASACQQLLPGKLSFKSSCLEFLWLHLGCVCIIFAYFCSYNLYLCVKYVATRLICKSEVMPFCFAIFSLIVSGG